MQTYEDKLLENERTQTRWLIRLKRASNKLEKLRLQRVRLLRAQAKDLTVEANATEKAAAAAAAPKGKRGRPERRINV